MKSKKSTVPTSLNAVSAPLQVPVKNEEVLQSIKNELKIPAIHSGKPLTTERLETIYETYLAPLLEKEVENKWERTSITTLTDRAFDIYYALPKEYKKNRDKEWLKEQKKSPDKAANALGKGPYQAFFTAVERFECLMDIFQGFTEAGGMGREAQQDAVNLLTVKTPVQITHDLHYATHTLVLELQSERKKIHHDIQRLQHTKAKAISYDPKCDTVIASLEDQEAMLRKNIKALRTQVLFPCDDVKDALEEHQKVYEQQYKKNHEKNAQRGKHSKPMVENVVNSLIAQVVRDCNLTPQPLDAPKPVPTVVHQPTGVQPYSTIKHVKR